MEVRLIDMLGRCLTNEHLSHLANAAISLIDRGGRIVEGGRVNESDIKDMLEVRRLAKFYKKGTVFGIDETIKNLKEGEIRLYFIDSDSDKSAVWVDNLNSVKGILLFKKLE